MTPTGYTRSQIALHWIVAALIGAQFLFSDAISQAWRAYEKGGTAVASAGTWAHVIPGVAILAFAVWRLMLRGSHGVPAPATGETPAQALIAKIVHVGLYGAIILLPISGAVAWFGGVVQAGDAHQLIKMALIALVALHVLGAVYNHFVLKNGLISRMLRSAD